jgi:hypothetical protein
MIVVQAAVQHPHFDGRWFEVSLRRVRSVRKGLSGFQGIELPEII